MATHRHATYHDLQGKRAIVLACTAGIGRAVAVALAEQGCRIALLSRNLTKLQRLQEQLQGESRVFQCDMNDPANVCSAVKAAIDGLGGLDILVVNTPGHSDATFAARASDDRLTCAQHHYTINTLAPVAAYQASRDALKAARGAVVCISSIATQFTSVQDAAFGYSGAKAALEAWAAGMAVEDGPQGVRINNVRPGVTVTAVWESAREAMGADPEQVLATTAAQTPLACNASPDNVAAAVLFLSSSASAFVTGTTLTVDGGFSHMHPLCMGYLKPAGDSG